jgi:dTDP-4-amino-4,6-dideoxygalactose transaminase/lipopolysaccharide/colanic/teichoic acid biosynthesis glycosyltransferase
MISKSTRFLPFHVPLIEEDDIRAVREVMESRWITTGPKAAQFEQEFARFAGARHAIAVNSGTAALHVGLEAIGLREGDEVIVPTLTFAATAEAVLYFKARPVLIDCEPDTFNLDPALVERNIRSRTRAIVPVHFAGHPCDMARLFAIARKHGLKVIEDAAHALSARYQGRMVGTLGDMTCFSFYATKNITTGEGGMVTTENDAWADRMRIMRLHGISKDAWKRYTAEGTWKYEILAPGFKYNLTDMQAAMGLTQLAKCHRMWARRNEMAQRYTDAFQPLDAFEVPSVRSDVQHAWHLYVLRVCPGVLSIHRDRLIEELKQRGIGTSVHFIPLHTHPYYRNRWRYRQGDFPVAEDYFDRCISLPLYPAMSYEDQTRVIDAITDIASMYRLAPEPLYGASGDRLGRQLHPELANHLAAPGSSTEAPLDEGSELSASFFPNPAQEESRDGWYEVSGKRVLDLIGALVGLLAALPVLAVCAVAVRLGSPGPLIFRQRRIGQSGRPFELLKFRTMIGGSEGPRITAAGDERVTGAGRWLRRWKLDELPQLINVLRGEMALVGPRPELAEYVATYTSEQRSVLKVKPGITSPASLIYVHEEEILARYPNPEEFYARVLLPHKLRIDQAYCRTASLGLDLRILGATVRRLLPRRGTNRANAAAFPSIASKPQV